NRSLLGPLSKQKACLCLAWTPRPLHLPPNAGVGSLSLLQGIFPMQASNQGLLHCGQILYQLKKLADCKLNVAEVTQSEIGQKQKLQTVLEAVQELLRPHSRPLQWSVDSIHGKNLVAILHLLVALAMHFRAPIHLPEHVSVQVVVVRKREGLLHSSHVTEELTTTTEMMMGRFERDAFDTLFDHAPDKLSVVKKFADGVYLVLLMGLLEDYFVPLHNFYLTPDSFDQKVTKVLELQLQLVIAFLPRSKRLLISWLCSHHPQRLWSPGKYNLLLFPLFPHLFAMK
ncbi:hypothetical protein FD754_015636, partial [Muntiacus muntjak]